jgi:ectoine hydroxylase-related dioxygenase (phytanoyl-CoA dioxygenase family)
VTVQHLSSNTTAADVVTALAADGAVIVDELVSGAVMDRLADELAPWVARTPTGPDEFSGHNTRRTGGLIARSRTARDLVMAPLVIDSVGQVLGHAKNYQLHLTQLISVGPGEPAQTLHRDQWAFDFFPFPPGYEVQCNTLWAVTEFTEENGATRVIPGSHHFEDKLRLSVSDTSPAEMAKGSVLLYVGSLYHGAGANRTDGVRVGANITYNLAWLRQEENQYLSVPLDIARTLPVELLKLMGYARGAYSLGYVDDLRDPISVVRPDLDGSGDSTS